MNYGTSILCRRNVRAYAAACVSYLLLAGQVAPLALGAAPRPPAASAAAATASAPAKAAPQPAPVVFAAPNIVATKVDAFPVHPSGKAEPGDVVSYTVTITNTGDMDATGVTFTDNVDTNTTLNPGTNTQPITDPDTYAASGNIPISLASPGVLDNDRDPDTGDETGLTVTKVGANVGSLNAANVGVATDTTATGRGSVKGSVTLAANGGFTYEPPPGFEGADTFAYEASDGTATDTQTVTINVGGASGMVWFIQNNAGGSNRGTFSQPFTSIAAFNAANAGTGAAPDPKDGDFIALRTGSGTYNEADGVNLRAQQKLIGNGVAFNSAFTTAAPNSSSAYTTFAGSAGTAPNITTTAGDGVDLSTDNTVRGLNVGNVTGFKIDGAAVGSPVINAVNLTGTGGALNVSTSGAFGANVTFGEFSSTSSAAANVNLVGVTGTLGITSTTGGLTGSAAGSPVINVSGGSVSFTVPSGGGSVAKSAGTAAAVSVAGGHTGTLTFNAAVSATAGTGLQFANADGTYNFSGTTTLNGGDAGVDITGGSGGTFNFSASTSITSPTGAAFNVGSSPGAPTVDYNGTITQNTANQSSVNIDGTTGGSITFDGAVTGDTDHGGIDINSANGNVTFTSPLTLGTSVARMTNQAVTITGGTGTYSLGTVSIFTSGASAQGIASTDADGTLNITAGTVDASGARAVNIDGPAGLTTLGVSLTTVSANGGANGISVRDTNGSFAVTGNGGNCTEADQTCTGGTIQNTTGGDVDPVASHPSGAGVALRNATNVSLTRVKVANHSNYGIHGTGVVGFTLANSVVNGANGTNVASPFRDSSVRLDQVTGTVSVTNSLLTGGHQHNLLMDNQSGTATVTVTGCTIKNTSAGAGDDGFQLEAEATAVVNAFVTNNSFSAHGGDHFNLTLINTADVDLVFTGNAFAGGHAIGLSQGLFVLGATFNGTFNYDISNNGTALAPLVGNRQVGMIHVNKGSGTGTFSGRIQNNFIGNALVNHSGSLEAFGIIVGARGAGGSHTVLINSNTVRQYHDRGIVLEAGEGAAALNATVTNNTVDNFADATNSLHGIHSDNGILSTDTNAVCMDIQDNLVTNAGNEPQGGADIRLRKGTQAGLSVRIPGLVGSTATDADNKITAENPSATTVTVSGAGFTGGAACTQPTVPSLPLSFDDTSSAGGIGVQSDTASQPAPTRGVKARPVALPRTDSAAPAAAAPVTAAPKAVRAEAKRSAGTTFRHTAADSSAPLNAEPLAQRRKVAKPVLTKDEPGGPNGAGGTVTVNIGTLRPNDSVTITFTVTLDNPYSGGPEISNQGTVSGTNFSSVLTDDPGTGAPNDATKTPINATDIRVNDASAAEPSTGTAQMLFTVTLTQPAPAAGVTVTYNTANGTATGGASCGGTVDYVTVAGGTATVPSGSKTTTIPVTVCADSDSPESSETLTVTISAPTSGNIVDNVATGTITQGTTAGTFLISELRTSGPAGLSDEFVEFYNNSDTPLTVAASDASAGYGVYKMGATCNDTPELLTTIPNGTVIPARGHYLAVGSAYSLANYGGTGAAAGNVTMASDIENDRNVAVFSTANVDNISSANRFDAVGFDGNSGAICDLLREGTNLGATAGSTTEHTFFRKQCDFVGGVGCSTPGNPKDTNDNSVDFQFADTQGTTIAGLPQKLGTPGPENLTSPIRRDTSGIGLALLDGSKPSSAVPNRFRDFTTDAPNNSSFGTLTIRRRVVNNTGGPVTRLRFRIIEMTTFPAAPGTADLRARTGVNEVSVGPVGDATTCTASGAGSPPCSVAVQATTLEQPPSQPNGGGLNSTLAAGTITTGTPLANGASLNVNFLLGIQQTGTFRFLIIIEALP